MYKINYNVCVPMKYTCMIIQNYYLIIIYNLLFFHHLYYLTFIIH